MKRKNIEGAVSLVGIGIAVAVIFGGVILVATHTPGNPPFSFTNRTSDTAVSAEKSIPAAMPASATATPPAPEEKKKQERKPVAQTAKKKTAATSPPAPQKTSYSLPSQTQRLPSWRPGCVSNTNPRFTHAFTDLSFIDGINPIGGIGGGSPGRSYIGVKAGTEAPVYAPMDAVLRVIIYANRGAGYGEYGLIFRATCEIEFMFDHLDRISDALAPYTPKVAAASSQFQGDTELNIPIKAGELLGYTNGTDLAHTFDFLVTNYAQKNRFLNLARWEWEQALYSQCPYDYFADDLKRQYYAKLGKPDYTGFKSAKECGNPAHDVAGTASGGWFKGDSTDKRGEYLAIARQYDEAQVAYRKDGQAFPDPRSVQTGEPFLNIAAISPDIYPADIKPGMSVCYGANSRWAYIKLVSKTELLMASGTGTCPAAFPEAQATAWIR